MNIQEVLDPSLLHEITDTTALGIDIGSRNAKAVLLHKGQLFTALIATGINMQTTAAELLENLFSAAGIALDDVDYIVGTGYGRVSLKFDKIPTEIITEISCHAMGAHFLNANTRTIIDIGGQDAKAIQVDPKNGKVIKFRMNDKCAAGTGRFLEKAAHLLDYTIHEVGPASLQAEEPSEISSQCVVFAESEVISLRATGAKRENIAAGIHFAAAKRVTHLLNQIPVDADLVFSGGVSNNVGMKHALEEVLGHKIVTLKLDMVFAGALGAAVYAQHLAKERIATQQHRLQTGQADLTDLTRKISDAQLSFAERKDVKKIGYLCTYTPVELLNAANTASIRLSKCGTPEVLVEGERITKSIFCDVTKSVLGYFAVKDTLYDAVDRVVTFYTCDSMRAAADAVDNYFKPTFGYVVPRSGKKDSAQAFFRNEIAHFKEDLEAFTGNAISNKTLQANIHLYNRLRQLIRAISALRKRNHPPLSGTDFLKITEAYRTVPAKELLPLLEDIYNRLSKVPDDNTPRLRIMMAGGMISDGDQRILEIIENDLHINVVVEDHCTGLSPFYKDTSETDDPLQDLANGYLNQAPCARQAPLSDRVDFSAHLAQEYHVDGIIFTYLKFCPCYGMTKSLFFKKYQEIGVPVLELDNDYSQGDSGQIKTRLEAFIEVLQETKGL